MREPTKRDMSHIRDLAYSTCRGGCSLVDVIAPEWGPIVAAYREEIEAPLRARIKELEAEVATPVLVATNRLADSLADARAENERLRDAGLAYQELSTCYRIGKQPTEKLFKRLDKARAALDLPALEAKKPSKREELLEAHLSACVDQMDQVAKMFRDDEDFMRALNEAIEILHPKEDSNA